MSYNRRFSEIYLIALILFSLALISFLGIDYLQSIQEKGQPILFSPDIKERRRLSSWIDKELFSYLKHQSGSSVKIIEITDKPLKKISVEIFEEAYEKLAPRLKDRLEKLGAESEVTVLEENEATKTLKWQLRRKGINEAILKFKITKPILAEPLPPLEPVLPLITRKKKPQEKMVALIIDDLGDNPEAIKAIIDLSRPINIAILPFSPYSREIAEIAKNYGLEIMLHLPLESINSGNNNGKEAIEINSQMNPDQILTILRNCLETLPEVKGVNNHMGSLITQIEDIMKIILSEIKARNLFFIDSRTTTKSIAYKLARQMGLACGERDVFLDSEVNERFIFKQVNQLIHLCEQKGKAIAIGHPYPETLKALPEIIKKIEGVGIKIVPVSQIIKP